MSLAEIKDAVTELTPQELAELAAFIHTQDNHPAKINASGSREDWPEFPVFDGGPIDGAINHDKYIYDEPGGISRERVRK
jgi:hypothetical protein